MSFNNLSGPTPNSGQFATFDESNYGGNPFLCGSQIKSSCSSQPTTPYSSAGEKEDESAIAMVSFLCDNNNGVGIYSYWRMQWFCFIDAGITSCYCWILIHVFHQFDDIYIYIYIYVYR